MDGGTQRGRPSFVGSFFSFVLSFEDMRSRKELAEDLIGDTDGLLMFVRRTYLFPIVAHHEKGFPPFFLFPISLDFSR
jgi:hypothetical protein